MKIEIDDDLTRFLCAKPMSFSAALLLLSVVLKEAKAPQYYEAEKKRIKTLNY